MTGPLVALVTGASRGMGRGIALALGDAGATVYVTGRTVRGAVAVDGAPGTIDDTADEVTARGGVGIAVRCDHSDATDVGRLVSGLERLDVLVNSAWGGYEHYDHSTFRAPFWEQPLERWPLMFDAGVRGAFVTTRACAPLLIAQQRGLVVHLSAGDGDRYRGALPYDVAKTAVERMTRVMARELRPHGVAVVALQPGFVDTERVQAAGIRGFESPEYAGRAVVALASDADVLSRSGGVFPVGRLAREYGFTDIDGTQPEVIELGPTADL